jgi:DNA-binding transcriptional LysR family regulator
VPLIAYHPRGFLQPAITTHLARQKTTANLLPLNENAQSASVKALVKQGFGMGWLPQRMAQKSEESGSLVRAGDERWDVTLEIRLLRLSQPRTQEFKTLWNTLETQYDR